MIYFLSILEGEYIKIGYTSQPVEKRRAALQTGNPHEIEIMHFIDGSLSDEKAIHRELKDAFERVKVFNNPANEWYPGKNPIIKTFIATVKENGLGYALKNIKNLISWDSPVRDGEVFEIRAFEKALRKNGYSRTAAKRIISENKIEIMERLMGNSSEKTNSVSSSRPKYILRKGAGRCQNYQEITTAMSL